MIALLKFQESILPFPAAMAQLVKSSANDQKFKGSNPASGLYYKTITIIIMTIVSDATIWSVTYDHN
jgi:hypothetical protein